MAMVTRALESGLVLAEQSADEAGLSRAIKEIDRRYVLQKHESDVAGGHVYVVVCVVSEDQEPIRILTWSDEYGNPLPLSSGIVEEVKKWRPEARARRGPDADERNRQLTEQTDKERRDQLADVTADHRARIERGRVQVSMGLQTKRPGWQRNTRPPQSGGDHA